MVSEDRVAPESRMKRFQRALDVEGCMSFNPFFRDISRQDLLQVFGEVSKGMEQACKDLVHITGVMHPVSVARRDVDGKVADILNAMRASNYEPDMFLAPAFMKAATKPYLLVEQLAKAEREGQGCNPEAVADVIDGLKDVKIFAEAVPLVYEAVYAYPSADRAVA